MSRSRSLGGSWKPGATTPTTTLPTTSDLRLSDRQAFVARHAGLSEVMVDTLARVKAGTHVSQPRCRFGPARSGHRGRPAPHRSRSGARGRARVVGPSARPARNKRTRAGPCDHPLAGLKGTPAGGFTRDTARAMSPSQRHRLLRIAHRPGVVGPVYGTRPGLEEPDTALEWHRHGAWLPRRTELLLPRSDQALARAKREHRLQRSTPHLRPDDHRRLDADRVGRFRREWVARDPRFETERGRAPG